jgi:hypothetical protein
MIQTRSPRRFRRRATVLSLALATLIVAGAALTAAGSGSAEAGGVSPDARDRDVWSITQVP